MPTRETNPERDATTARRGVPTLVHTLRGVPSRRDVLSGLAAAGSSLGLATLPALSEAKPRRRKKPKRSKRPKRAKPNRFGCLEYNDPCRSHRQCCSGICTGKPGRKRCRAHGAGTCSQRVEGICTTTGNASSLRCNSNPRCFCFETTGGNNFCGAWFDYKDCASCRRDRDCLAIGFPAGSACVPVSKGECTTSGCPNGMVCMAPCGATPPVEM